MADSQTCTHPNAGTHEHTNSDGSIKQVWSCPSCGLEV
jgi:hypothetical protein